jgi:hypothetical protein
VTDEDRERYETYQCDLQFVNKRSSTSSSQCTYKEFQEFQVLSAVRVKVFLVICSFES